MRPWRNPHTIAVLWVLVGLMLVLLIAGRVSEYEMRLQWSQVRPVKPPPASVCRATNHGAWCP